jgi:hypothetical protein
LINLREALNNGAMVTAASKIPKGLATKSTGYAFLILSIFSVCKQIAAS